MLPNQVSSEETCSYNNQAFPLISSREKQFQKYGCDTKKVGEENIIVPSSLF